MVSIYSTTGFVFYVAAIIANKTIGRYIRAQNEEHAKRIVLNAWENADISMVEYIGGIMPQDNKRVNFFYDKAAHDEDHGMQNALL